MKTAPPPPNAKLDELQAKARYAAEQGRHKEAILFCKDLLKLEKRPEWEQALAEAYRLRAAQVAGKGMWQEAAILWENHAKLVPGAAPSDEYLSWLARAGQFPKLAQWLAGEGAAADGPFARRLPEALAVLALQNEKLLAPFPKDHPIPRHHALAKQALRAYAAGRDAEAEEALRQIPSRSPYRNVRTLVKSLLLLPKDRAAGIEGLGRVEADSLCRGLASRLARQCQPGGPDFSREGGELPAKLQGVVGKLNGYGKAQLGLLKDLKKFAKDAPPRQTFNAALNHREALGESACRRLCFALLVDFPEGADLYQKAFGKLPPFEHKRLRALHEERQDYPAEAALHWQAAIEELKKQPPTDGGALDQALIFRHIAKLAWHDEPDIAIDALQASLKLDPTDRASHADLIRLCSEADDPKEAQEWLERALSRFPKDVEFLTLAMREAGRRKAFKKAAALAKEVLEIDPINAPARQFLLDAHLGHARKQAKAGKSHLAAQELEQARALDPRRKSAALCFVEGLASLREADRASALLIEGWRLAGKGLAAQFQLNLETQLLGLPLKASAGLAPALAKSHSASREELLALAGVLGRYAGEDKKRLAEALKPLKTPLGKAFRQEGLGEEDYFSLCQAFARAGLFDTLHDCTMGMLRHFPFAAAPVYFQVYARCKGVAARISELDENRLAHALELARANGDRRTGILVEQMLRRLDEALADDEADGIEALLPGGLEQLQANLTPDLERRILELDDLPTAKLLAIASEAVPGLPLKNLPREDLLNIARMALLGELGIDLKKLLEGQSPFGPFKLR